MLSNLLGTKLTSKAWISHDRGDEYYRSLECAPRNVEDKYEGFEEGAASVFRISWRMYLRNVGIYHTPEDSQH